MIGNHKPCLANGNAKLILDYTTCVVVCNTWWGRTWTRFGGSNVEHKNTHTQLHVKHVGPIFDNLCSYRSVGAGGLRGQCLSKHAPHRILSWARIHHVGPAEQVLHPKTETNMAITISQISYSYSMATLCFNIPRPLTPALANPPKSIFLRSLMFLILIMCPAHYMRVLLNIAGIYSMLHLVTTSTLLSFCHHFTLDSLRRKPMWMALNFPA